MFYLIVLGLFLFSNISGMQNPNQQLRQNLQEHVQMRERVEGVSFNNRKLIHWFIFILPFFISSVNYNLENRHGVADLSMLFISTIFSFSVIRYQQMMRVDRNQMQRLFEYAQENKKRSQ